MWLAELQLPQRHPGPNPCGCHLIWLKKKNDGGVYPGLSRRALNTITCIFIRGRFDTDKRRESKDGLKVERGSKEERE